MAVYGCVRALMAAVVAVMVAVRDMSGTFRLNPCSGESLTPPTCFPSLRGWVRRRVDKVCDRGHLSHIVSARIGLRYRDWT
jgi:hypothetical protein